MREICTSGSEGGGAVIPLSLPYQTYGIALLWWQRPVAPVGESLGDFTSFQNSLALGCLMVRVRSPI